MTLRFNAQKQAVTISIPKRSSLKSGRDFAVSRTHWLDGQVAKHPRQVALMDGAVFPLFGQDCTISLQAGRGVTEQLDDELHIYGLAEFTERRVIDWLKKTLREEIISLVGQKKDLLGDEPKAIQIRETTHHWGSCSAKKTLSFSWRLVFAHPEILDYLVAHEMAHLREMNHSPDFWALVERLCPDYKRHREWLKKQGHSLYCWGS